MSEPLNSPKDPTSPLAAPRSHIWEGGARSGGGDGDHDDDDDCDDDDDDGDVYSGDDDGLDGVQNKYQQIKYPFDVCLGHFAVPFCVCVAVYFHHCLVTPILTCQMSKYWQY